jgi:hypothetical protein
MLLRNFMLETRSVPTGELTEDLATSHGTMVMAMLIWLLWVAMLVLRHNHPELSIF